MRKCPKCKSLVDDERTECCGAPLPALGGAAPAATVVLSPEQLAAVTGSSRAATRPPAPVAPPPVPLNPAADRAWRLGLLSVLPLFPIAFAAFGFGILGLTQAARHPARLGRGRAWFGLLVGALFGVLWTAVTVSLLFG